MAYWTVDCEVASNPETPSKVIERPLALTRTVPGEGAIEVVGDADGDATGESEGAAETVGAMVGASDAVTDGAADGTMVGTGVMVGDPDGAGTGAADGATVMVGAPLCTFVGAAVGAPEGASEALGAALGAGVTGFGVEMGSGASSHPQLRLENICKATQLADGTKPCLERSSSNPHSNVP